MNKPGCTCTHITAIRAFIYINTKYDFKKFSLLQFFLTTFENDALFFIIKYVKINQLLSKTMQNNRIISSNITG